MADDQSERAWAIFDLLADVPADQREAALRAAQAAFTRVLANAATS